MGKKYKIGYTSGTFDLFHVGHLNILKKAKEQCDFLIVGVYSDECVKNYKKVQTVFNTEMRAVIIKALQYADQVSVCENRDKVDAWSKFKFDAIFIGDDWKGSDDWNTYEKEMEEKGVDVIYIPYTKGISTSIIKQKINEAIK